MPDKKRKYKVKPHRYRRPGVKSYMLRLPEELVDRLDELEGARSHHVEKAVREYLDGIVQPLEELDSDA